MVKVQVQPVPLSVLAGEGPAGAIAQFGAVVIPHSWGRRLPRGQARVYKSRRPDAEGHRGRSDRGGQATSRAVAEAIR